MYRIWTDKKAMTSKHMNKYHVTKVLFFTIFLLIYLLFLIPNIKPNKIYVLSIYDRIYVWILYTCIQPIILFSIAMKTNLNSIIINVTSKSGLEMCIRQIFVMLKSIVNWCCLFDAKSHYRWFSKWYAYFLLSFC